MDQGLTPGREQNADFLRPAGYPRHEPFQPAFVIPQFLARIRRLRKRAILARVIAARKRPAIQDGPRCFHLSANSSMLSRPPPPPSQAPTPPDISPPAAVNQRRPS